MDGHTRRIAAAILLLVAGLFFWMAAAQVATDRFAWANFGFAASAIAAALLVAP